MNADQNDFGDEFDDNSSAEVSPEIREFIKRQVERTRHKQLISLTPQLRVQRCLSTGLPANCQATYQINGQPTSFDVHLERTANGGLDITAPNWPTSLEPLSVVVLGSSRFGQFRENSTSFAPVITSLLRTDSGDSPQVRSKRIPSLIEAPVLGAATEVDDDQITDLPQVTFEWTGEQILKVYLDDDQLEETVSAVAELLVHGQDTPIYPKLVVLKETDDGTLYGKIKYPRPESTYLQKGKLHVRPLTSDDIHLFEFERSHDISEVTRFLAAKEDFAVCVLLRTGERLRSSKVPRNEDAAYGLSASPYVEKKRVENCPFEVPARSVPSQRDHRSLREIDDEEINDTLRKFAEHRQAGDNANAKLELGVLLEKLEIRITRAIGWLTLYDSHAIEEVFNDLGCKIWSELAEAVTDNRIAWCHKVAYHLACDHRRKQKRESTIPAGHGLELENLSFARDNADDETVHVLPLDTARHIGRLSERERNYLLEKYSNPQKKRTDEELQEKLGLSLDQLRYLKESSEWKLKSLDALEFLGNRLLPAERQLLEMTEVDKAEVADIQRELSLTKTERRHLTRKLKLKLHATIALRSLRLFEDDQRVVLDWITGEAPTNASALSRGIQLTLGQRLHAQILLEIDFLRRKQPTLGRLGAIWLEQTIIRRTREDVAMEVLRRYQAFDGNLHALKQKVRDVWETTDTLVPKEYVAWM